MARGDDLPGAAGWAVRPDVWLERAGRAVLGPERVALLRAIEQGHSISEAARRVGMSYRKAWLLVDDINAAAGVPLVAARTGGAGGGGATLTDHGRAALAAFMDAQDRLGQAAAGVLRTGAPVARDALHVAAAVSLEEVLGQLLGDYSRCRPGVRVRVVFGASDELADHLLAGGPADLFLAASQGPLDRLAAQGLLGPGVPVLLAANALALLAAVGRAPPVRRPQDLLRPEVGRVAMAGASTPLGGYTRAFLEAHGLYEAVLARAVVVDNARAVVDSLRAGQADLGLAYGSAARWAGCRVLFRVRRPPAPIRYVGAVLHQARQPAEARRLLEFITSTAAARRFRRCGFLALPRQGPPQGPLA
jgi:molybdate transport system substrate-binding protein